MDLKSTQCVVGGDDGVVSGSDPESGEGALPLAGGMIAAWSVNEEGPWRVPRAFSASKLPD